MIAAGLHGLADVIFDPRHTDDRRDARTPRNDDARTPRNGRGTSMSAAPGMMGDMGDMNSQAKARKMTTATAAKGSKTTARKGSR
jgi:hypothetical protein